MGDTRHLFRFNDNYCTLLIGLDFDGVLHSIVGQNLFVHMPQIQQMVQDLKNQDINIHLVITSTWRNNFEAEKIISIFPQNLHKNLVGQTPDFENGGANRDLEFSQFRKNYEKSYNINFDFAIAIDDNAHLFTDLPYLLFKTESRLGFIEEKKQELTQLIFSELSISQNQAKKVKLM